MATALWCQFEGPAEAQAARAQAARAQTARAQTARAQTGRAQTARAQTARAQTRLDLSTPYACLAATPSLVLHPRPCLAYTQLSGPCVCVWYRCKARNPAWRRSCNACGVFHSVNHCGLRHNAPSPHRPRPPVTGTETPDPRLFPGFWQVEAPRLPSNEGLALHQGIALALDNVRLARLAGRSVASTANGPFRPDPGWDARLIPGWSCNQRMASP
jgi:hypothetical protein